MKALLLLVLVQISLFANAQECESALTLFDFSIKQEKPISDGLLMMTIAYCEDVPQYGQVITQIMNMIETTEVQTF